MARFYRMSLCPALVGRVSLVRQWGRIGTRGHERVDLFDDVKQAEEVLLRLERSKRRRGYLPVEAEPNVSGDGVDRGLVEDGLGEAWFAQTSRMWRT